MIVSILYINSLKLSWIKNVYFKEDGAFKLEMTGYTADLFVLRFYGPFNPMGSCRAWSVYLTTRLLVL